MDNIAIVVPAIASAATSTYVSTHGEGGTVIIKGNAKGRVGGQMVKGDIYVYGTIENPLPGFKLIGEVEREVDGEKALFAHHIGGPR